MSIFRQLQSQIYNQPPSIANQRKQAYPQLQIDVIYVKEIQDHVFPVQRFLFNIFGGVPIMQQLHSQDNERLLRFFKEYDKRTIINYINDPEFQKMLYKYLSKIKMLLQSGEFVQSPGFWQNHSHLKSFFMSKSFDESCQETIRAFQEQLKTQDAIYDNQLLARIRKTSLNQSFRAQLKNHENIYSRAVQYADFAQIREEREEVWQVQLLFIHERMSILKEPLLSIYKNSWFGELEQVYQFLGVTHCSFDKQVDLFLRSVPRQQLQMLMDIKLEKANQSTMVSSLREHEYVLFAFCMLKADNQKLSKPTYLYNLERRINQLDNEDWLAETLQSLIQQNPIPRKQFPNQLAPIIQNFNKGQNQQDNCFQIINNGHPLQIGRKRNIQQSTIVQPQRRSQLELVSCQPKRSKFESIQHEEVSKLDVPSQKFQPFKGNIWLNQQMIEACLVVAKQINQKCIHFYGVEVQQKFLQAQPGDYICTQAVAWKQDIAPHEQEIWLSQKNTDIETALFSDLKCIGHLALIDDDPHTAWQDICLQLKEVFPSSHIQKTFLIMRNLAEDDEHTDFASEDEFIRPMFREGSVKWTRSELCNNIRFDPKLPYYFLKQEGEHPKSWFSANVISQTNFRAIKLHQFWKNLLGDIDPLETLFTTSYMDIFDSKPLVHQLMTRNLKMVFERDYEINTEGTLVSLKMIEKVVENEQINIFDQINKDPIDAPSSNHRVTIQRAQRNLQNRSSLIEEEESGSEYTEEEFQSQINSRRRPLFGLPVNQIAREDHGLRQKIFGDTGIFNQRSISNVRTTVTAGGQEYINDEDDQMLQHALQLSMQSEQFQVYSDTDPATIKGVLDKLSDSIKRGYLSCSILDCQYKPEDENPWFACVNPKCHAIYCLQCSQQSIKMGRDKLYDYGYVDETILIWKCIQCTLPHPNDDELQQKQFLELKRIFEKEMQKKNELPSDPQNQIEIQQEVNQPQAMSFGNLSQPGQNNQFVQQLPNVNVLINQDEYRIEINQRANNLVNDIQSSQPSNPSPIQSNQQSNNGSNQSQQQNSHPNNSAPNQRGNGNLT